MRIHYFDFLRGLAILMVVAIHTNPTFGFDSFHDVTKVAVRQLLNSAVPLFFAISGYFLASKCLNNLKDIRMFWKHQIPKVYIPVLVWSFPLLIRSLFSGSARGFITYAVCGYSVYYFIAVIIQCYILLPLLAKANRRVVITCFCISMISVSFFTYIMQVKGVVLPLIAYAGHVDLWLIFFVLGIALRRFPKNYTWHWPLFFAGVTWTMQLVESYWLFGYHGGGVGIKPSSFLFSIAVILLAFTPSFIKGYTEKTWVARLIRLIGSLSFGIYLIHCFFIKLLPLTGLNNISWILKWFVVVTLSTTVTILARKYLPASLNLRLGL